MTAKASICPTTGSPSAAAPAHDQRGAAEQSRGTYTGDDLINNLDPTGRFSFFDGLVIGIAVAGLFATGVGIAAALPGVTLAAWLTDTAIAVGVVTAIVGTAVTIGCAFSESC